MKTEQVDSIFIMNVEGNFATETKEKVLTSASASTSSPIFPLSHYAQATHAVLAFLGVSHISDPLQ